jgi:hypothetical protein
MSAKPNQLPEPDVMPAPITNEQYFEFSAPRTEMVGGYLYDGPVHHQERINMLALLMTNEGLARVLLLAPEAKWRKAMQQIFGKV